MEYKNGAILDSSRTPNDVLLGEDCTSGTSLYNRIKKFPKKGVNVEDSPTAAEENRRAPQTEGYALYSDDLRHFRLIHFFISTKKTIKWDLRSMSYFLCQNFG